MKPDTDTMEDELGLDPTLYKVHGYKFTRSTGQALISIYDIPLNFDDMVEAHVSRSSYFDIEYFGDGNLPKNLDVKLNGEIVKVHLVTWHGNIGSYEVNCLPTLERMPYCFTNR